MADERMPHEIIKEMVADRAAASDAEVLAELKAFPPLPDETDPAWDRDETWQEAYRFVALGDVAAARKLTPAIRLLLERACYGDPGEMFRGLRHTCEAIVKPNWSELADVCLEAVKTDRLGTRHWAIYQLMILDDERARPVFEESLRRDPDDVKSLAEGGLERLDRKRAERG